MFNLKSPHQNLCYIYWFKHMFYRLRDGLCILKKYLYQQVKPFPATVIKICQNTTEQNVATYYGKEA